MSRNLKANPSNPMDKLSPWQVQTLENLETLHQEAWQERKSLAKYVQDFPVPKDLQALLEVAFAAQITGLSQDEAEQKAKEYLKAGPANYTGIRNTCILQWCFKPKSY